MSLSGGLDSRTSLIALLSHNHRLPCVTMAGSPHSLDVGLAKALCEAYGLVHHTVLLDGEFRRRSPELLIRSADLTGGVACLGQTADLFLYESMPASLTARVSGNLGNQVGRGGVESLSAYQPSPEIFSREVRERLQARPVAPWFIPRLAGGDYGRTLFSQEVHFWSIANYVVGSSHAYQLTPYADRRLMHLSCAAFAQDNELQHPTWKVLRARDLRHRLAGTPKERSFQRQFLAQKDCRGSHIPLNWGWRAEGGWSLGWSMTAMASAADAGLTKLGGKSELLRPAARWLSAKLGHRSALVDWPQVLKTHLQELAMDTFTSRHVRQVGIFDPCALDKMLREHFGGVADHQYTVSRSLEVALGISCRASNPFN
jgi:asparagine synthetase B (glutamine-hydrolysing)